MPEYPIGIDPSKIDTDTAAAQADFVDQSREDRKKSDEAAAIVAKEEQDAEAQALAEQQDPRNAKKWGIGAVSKELQSAVTGGIHLLQAL